MVVNRMEKRQTALCARVGVYIHESHVRICVCVRAWVCVCMSDHLQREKSTVEKHIY